MTKARPKSPRSRSNASDAAGDAWDRAVRLLAVHDRSEQEIRTRLADAGAAPATIDRTVRRLQHLGYLDDARCAAGAAEQAVRRGYGSAYVQAHLAARGVADGLIEAAIRANFGDEGKLARRALTHRYPTPPQQPRDRMKAARYLLRRGFPEEVVFAILGEDC